VNPPFHDEFVRFVALFYAEELTDEEWALLQVHMAYCDSCRETFEQYQYIASDFIPAMAASVAAEARDTPRESEQELLEASRRLMSRLETRSKGSQQPSSRRWWGQIYTWAAVAACIIAALIYGSVRYRRALPSAGGAVAKTVITSPTVTAPTQIATNRNDEDLLKQDETRVASLEKQLLNEEKREQASDAAAADAKRLLVNEEAQLQQLVAQRDALGQQLATAQVAAQALREKLTSVENGTGQQSARLVELQARVDHLNSALEDANAALDSKEQMLAFDRDLMMHDRDVRDVIGARNLYIADIYDTITNGSTAKPFGRIFYTKDQSLVLYGFDLDKQPGLQQTSAFQVWGGSTDRQPVNLGLLYQDDSHKRWILKCNDAATLARLNSIFVTVEPPGGSKKPTGKRFLRAYLQIQPNHP
jgi:hypothetical protein